MLWDAEYTGAKFDISVQWIVDLFTRVLKDVYAFVLGKM